MSKEDPSLKNRGVRIHDLEVHAEGVDLVVTADVEGVRREVIRERIGRDEFKQLHTFSIGVTPLGILSAKALAAEPVPREAAS